MFTAARSSGKMRKVSKDGDAISLDSLTLLLTGVTFTRFLEFSIALPNTELFISWWKFFSNLRVFVSQAILN